MKILLKLKYTFLKTKKVFYLIIENFYSLYMFLSFLISISISKKREMLLIEIASRLDRYIEAIEPSFKRRFLHRDDLAHHYAVYELKELKNTIFKGLVPQ